jgi:hypothetical protein
LAVQGNVGVLVIGLVVLAIASGIIVAISLYPPWRKAAGEMADGIIRSAHESERVMKLHLQKFGRLADMIVDLVNELYKIVTNKCRPEFNEFSERKSAKLVLELGKPKPSFELVFLAAKAWMESLWELAKCMGPSAWQLFVLLKRVWGTESIMDLIIQILGDHWQPPPMMIKQLQP